MITKLFAAVAMTALMAGASLAADVKPAVVYDLGGRNDKSFNEGAFNGAGDTRTPTWINLCCLWLLEIPLAWFLAGTGGFGPTGAFIAVSVAFFALAIVSSWLFSKGHWKTQRV